MPKIDLSVCADRKMVNLYVNLRYITKKSQFYRADTQIKNIKMVFLRAPLSAKENKFYTVLCVSAYLCNTIFSKEITALGCVHRQGFFINFFFYTPDFALSSPLCISPIHRQDFLLLLFLFLYPGNPQRHLSTPRPTIHHANRLSRYQLGL